MDHAARREADRQMIQSWIDQGLVKTPSDVGRRLGITRQAVAARKLGLVFPDRDQQLLEERMHLGLSPTMVQRLDAVRAGATRQEFIRSAVVAALDARQSVVGTECVGCAAGDFSCAVCGRSYEVAGSKVDFVIQADETTMRWFGPERPRRQSPQGEVATPVGQPCSACGTAVAAGEQGWTIPRRGEGERSVYHHGCMWKALGLPEEA